MRMRRIFWVAVIVVALAFGFWGGWVFKPCPEPKPVAVKKPVIKKPAAVKPQVKQVQVVEKPISAQPTSPQPTPAPPAPVPVLPVIPAAAPEQRLALRLNVVEWSPVFDGKCLESRQTGPLIRKGLAEGTVRRASVPITFLVNGMEVLVHNGQAIVDPGHIGPETTIVVRSLGGRFASPPDGLPLVTKPGELDSLVKKGAREIWLNFILLDP